MRNKIYELNDGRQYIVLLEEKIDERLFVILSECNYDRDEINTDELLLKEVFTNSDKIGFKNVDNNEATKILLQLLSRNIEIQLD